jgi:multidrug efflux pump subunit AcrA (membrane-fusion protein)
MIHRTIPVILCLAVMFGGGLVGCGRKPGTKEETKPECQVLYPESRPDVQDYVEYTGRTAAVASVDVKARVTGFLKQVLFKEGEEVKEGQELFLIDPTPYLAQLEQAEAQVGLYEAQVELTTTTYEQAKKVAEKNPKAFSELQLRTYDAQRKAFPKGKVVNRGKKGKGAASGATPRLAPSDDFSASHPRREAVGRRERSPK